MNKEETVRYLSNVYLIVLADGVVERIEERVFEEISREIHADYFERKQAMEMAKTEGLQTDVASRWSDRIRNLEDMLFAAYCNGVLDPAEKKVVLEYASALGIEQRQVDTIRQEAKRRYAEMA